MAVSEARVRTGETYWKIRNGIRLSGMPGYQNALTDEQMWQISGLLAHADKLPPAVMEELRRSEPLMSAPAAPTAANRP